MLKWTAVKLCRADLAGREECWQPSAVEERQLGKATAAGGPHSAFTCHCSCRELHNEAMIPS